MSLRAITTPPATFLTPRDLDRMDAFDADDRILAAIAVLDAKLGVLIADQERLVRLLTAVAGVVDCRIEVGDRG